MNEAAREMIKTWAIEKLDQACKLSSNKIYPVPTGNPVCSVYDGIDGEIAWLIYRFYSRVWCGEDVETVFAEILTQAKAAARDFSEFREATWKNYSTGRDTSHWITVPIYSYSEDEAETKIRHARRMVGIAMALESTTSAPVAVALQS